MTSLPISDVVNAQTWEVSTLKNPIEPPQILEQKIFLPFYVLSMLQLVLPTLCPPTPPLSQHFALSEKKVLILA